MNAEITDWFPRIEQDENRLTLQYFYVGTSRHQWPLSPFYRTLKEAVDFRATMKDSPSLEIAVCEVYPRDKAQMEKLDKQLFGE